MKTEELEAVGKLIEGEEVEGSSLVGLLFVKKKDEGASGWTLVFPEGISPEFQVHVLECLRIDPSKVQITQTPPVVSLETLGAKEEDGEEEEEDNGFHPKFGGDL